jgi:hypothetical protein
VDHDDTVEDLQSVSQHVLTVSARISALEAEKRTVDPGSEQFRVLSDEIEQLAEEIRTVSHAETRLAVNIAGERGLPTVEEADSRR